MDAWYADCMCLKTVEKSRIHPPTAENYGCVQCIEDRCVVPETQCYLCVKPKGHAGPCSHYLHDIFTENNEKIAKLIGSVRLAIYSTPGNDDYVFKNRASRLFGIALTSNQASQIRDKNEKKKCAIPKKDMSNPTFLAQAYLDWFVFVCSIRDIQDYINFDAPEYQMILTHKQMLIQYYRSFNREIFSAEGFTQCVITRKECALSDFADPDRDNRKDIKDTDIQLGHNKPRSDNFISIRGFNLLPMSRRGNLIIGERVFTQEVWRDELRAILSG
jgi:hypothetical protein